jgi:hypothetical protein
MPRLADRLWDAAALACVLGGAGLFLFARRALTSMGDGTYALPPGISAVATTDLHVAQSRLGMVIVGLGVLIGVIAAVRHARREVRATRRDGPSIA